MLTIRRSLATAGMLAAAMFAVSTAAIAGECPADKVVASGKGQKPGATAPKDVTDKVLASIDLEKEIKGLKGRHMRIRELVIQPGGEVPWHSHDDRPALIYVLEGTVVEYASNCAVPIVHKAGEVSVERKGVSHWWKNETNSVVRLTSSDILHDAPMNMAQRMK